MVLDKRKLLQLHYSSGMQLKRVRATVYRLDNETLAVFFRFGTFNTFLAQKLSIQHMWLCSNSPETRLKRFSKADNKR